MYTDHDRNGIEQLAVRIRSMARASKRTCEEEKGMHLLTERGGSVGTRINPSQASRFPIPFPPYPSSPPSFHLTLPSFPPSPFDLTLPYFLPCPIPSFFLLPLFPILFLLHLIGDLLLLGELHGDAPGRLPKGAHLVAAGAQHLGERGAGGGRDFS